MVLLAPAGPSLGKSPAGALSGRTRLAARGRALAGRFAVAPGRTKAELSGACAFANSSVRRTPADDLRAAVVCLINRARSRWRLPAVHAQGEIERAAQGHTGQMVSINALTHDGAGGSNPGSRLSEAGYRWSAFGEVLASGYPTPRRAVDAWLASPDHCPIMLSPVYRSVGVGVVPGAVRGVANIPGTWTADFGLRMGRRPPSGNWGPANSCPH